MSNGKEGIAISLFFLKWVANKMEKSKKQNLMWIFFVHWKIVLTLRRPWYKFEKNGYTNQCDRFHAL